MKPPNADITALAGAGWGLAKEQLVSSQAPVGAPRAEILQSFGKLALEKGFPSTQGLLPSGPGRVHC